MYITIIGAGRTGYDIAAAYSQNPEQQVTVIDSQQSKLEEAQNTLNVAAVVGDCSDEEALARANVAHSDCCIAASHHDERNIIACILSKRIGAKKTIAFTRSNFYQRPEVVLRYKQAGVDHIIHRNQIITVSVLRECDIESQVTLAASFAKQRVLLLAYRVSAASPLCGTRLKDLPPDNFFLIGGILRGNVSSVPSGEDTILPDDRIYLLIAVENLDRLYAYLKVNPDHSHKAIVFGETDPVIGVTCGLHKNNYEVSVICCNHRQKKAVEAGIYSPHMTQCLVGDPIDMHTLESSGIRNAHFFIALSGDEETNLLAGMASRYYGVDKTITSAERQDIRSLMHMSGIEACISLRHSVLHRLKGITGGMADDDFASITDTEIEVLALRIEAGVHSVIGKPLSQIGLPQHTLVGMILHPDHSLSIASGSSVFGEGDKVILFTLPENVERIHTLLGGESKRVDLQED